VQEAGPVLLMLGVGSVALVLVLIGIFVGGRSRRPTDGAGVAFEPTTVVPVEPASSSSLPQPVQFHLEATGSAWVEIEGRRFDRLSDIGDERLAQRVLAAVEAIQRFASIAPAPSEPGRVDELRVGHAQEDGTLMVEFKGQRYRRLTDIRDGETGRGLLALVGELSVFAQGLVKPPAGPGELPSQVEQEFLEQLARPVSGPAPVRLPSLVNSPSRAASKPEPMPVGIAGQVEKILQQQFALDPVWQGRSIHLVTAKDGSLSVEEQGRLLHWPDGVTDPLVRQVVEKAIRLWERQAG
jgi:hypothetical protein